MISYVLVWDVFYCKCCVLVCVGGMRVFRRELVALLVCLCVHGYTGNVDSKQWETERNKRGLAGTDLNLNCVCGQLVRAYSVPITCVCTQYAERERGCLVSSHPRFPLSTPLHCKPHEKPKHLRRQTPCSARTMFPRRRWQCTRGECRVFRGLRESTAQPVSRCYRHVNR